eukprot:2181046-Amphidinium_carterae.1
MTWGRPVGRYFHKSLQFREKRGRLAHVGRRPRKFELVGCADTQAKLQTSALSNGGVERS